MTPVGHAAPVDYMFAIRHNPKDEHQPNRLAAELESSIGRLHFLLGLALHRHNSGFSLAPANHSAVAYTGVRHSLIITQCGIHVQFKRGSNAHQLRLVEPRRFNAV